MKHLPYVLIGLAGFVLLAGMCIAPLISRRDSKEAQRAAALERFCQATRISMRTTYQALEDPELAAKEKAFHADTVFHEMVHRGYTSVETCLGARTPRTPDNWAECRMSDDYGCIAKQIRAYHDALAREGF